MTDAPRVVLVTGASSGIGRAVALRSASNGDHVVLLARGGAALREVAEECTELGAASTLVTPADVGYDGAVRGCVSEIVSAYGVIDVVAHCAGVVAYGRTEEVPADVFEKVLRTNLLGSVNLARHVVPVLRDQRHGALVLVGSLIGHIAVPTMSPYVLSKWGIRALARQLQVENRDRPEVVLAYVAPGGVDTPIYRQAANYAGAPGRPPPPVASPERIADAVLARARRQTRLAQVGVTNHLVIAGFSFLPAVYDALVGPLFAFAATDRTTVQDRGAGNVMTTGQEGNALRGDQGNPLVGILRNVTARLRTD